MIIALCSQKRGGKDTLADHLIKKYDYTKYSFADPIKKSAMEIFGFTKDQMWGSTKDKETVDERWGISPRQALQIMGTELFQYDFGKHLPNFEKKIGRSIWVKKFEYWYKKNQNLSDAWNVKNKECQDFEIVKINDFNCVIPDLRFKHEYDIVKKLGGQLWEITNNRVERGDTHASETEWYDLPKDITIVNNGSYEELYKEIDRNLK